MSDIRPDPTEEEAVAIVAALELLWPKPVIAEAAPSASQWRLSGRWWQDAQGWPRRGY